MTLVDGDGDPLPDNTVITVEGDGAIFKATALTSHPVTGELIAVIRGCVIGPCPRELATINPSTGVATVIGPLGDNFAGLAFVPET